MGVAAVSGEANPYTIGQVLAGQTNGGVLTSTTYHGGVKVAGFPYTKVAVVPHTYTYGYPYAYYGKREAEAEPEPWTVGQIAAGAHVAEAIKDGRAHNVGVITNAAIAPIAATHVAYAGYPYTYYGKREAEADSALLYTPSPTLPSAPPTPQTLESAPTSVEPLCHAAGRERPTPPWSTLVPCPTPTEFSPTPASTAPTPSTPSPTPPPD